MTKIIKKKNFKLFVLDRRKEKLLGPSTDRSGESLSAHCIASCLLDHWQKHDGKNWFVEQMEKTFISAFQGDSPLQT